MNTAAGRSETQNPPRRASNVLWLYDETEPFAIFPADKLTAFKAGMIACGLLDLPELPKRRSANVVDLAAARLTRLAESGPDA
jgi:hypothetical protein